MSVLFPYTKAPVRSMPPPGGYPSSISTNDNEDDQQGTEQGASDTADDERPAIDPTVLSTLSAPPSPNTPVPVGAAPLVPSPGIIDDSTARKAIKGQPLHPERDVTIPDPLEREENYKERVQAYEPQPARGWWNRYVKPMIMGSLAGARTGSPWGLLGGAGAGAAVGAIKPTLEDEKWKAKETAESQAAIDQSLETAKNKAVVADLQSRPAIAQRKLDQAALHEKGMQEQREWSRRFQEGKQDTYEDYLQWKMDNGDRRADTADGQADLRREYLQIRKHAQQDKERHEKVMEGQGQEKIKQSQYRIDHPRSASSNALVRGAQSAIAKFNQLTTRIATANSIQDYGTAKALMDERNSHEEKMRQLYGDVLDEDAHGKPTRLKPGVSLTTPAGGYKIEDAVKAFKAKHGRDPNKAETQKMQAAIDAMSQ